MAITNDFCMASSNSNGSDMDDIAFVIQTVSQKKEEDEMNTNEKLRSHFVAIDNMLGKYLSKEITTDVSLIGRIENILKEALSIPLRNCDVGTVREQDQRFNHFCGSHIGCVKCPLSEGVYSCALTWAQLPCEKGANDEQS